MKEIFTIIIPNYNRESSVTRAIDSVLAQTFSDFEIIVVDDCSTDNSWKVIKNYNDPRLKAIRLEKNSGAAAARNEGIKKARGQYISLLDSDDHYEPRFLVETYETIKSTGDSIGFMWTGLRYIEKSGQNEFYWSPSRKETPYLTFLHSLHIGTNSGITFKKIVFDECGDFNSALPAAEDTDFFLRITQKFDFTSNPNILINIERDNEDRLSKNFKKIAFAYNIFMPRHFPVINNSIVLQKKMYYKLMWLNFNLKDKSKAELYFSKIPKRGLRYLPKIFLIYWTYKLLPLEPAKKFHLKFGSNNKV